MVDEYSWRRSTCSPRWQFFPARSRPEIRWRQIPAGSCADRSPGGSADNTKNAHGGSAERRRANTLRPATRRHARIVEDTAGRQPRCKTAIEPRLSADARRGIRDRQEDHGQCWTVARVVRTHLATRRKSRRLDTCDSRTMIAEGGQFEESWPSPTSSATSRTLIAGIPTRVSRTAALINSTEADRSQRRPASLDVRLQSRPVADASTRRFLGDDAANIDTQPRRPQDRRSRLHRKPGRPLVARAIEADR